MKVFKGIFTFIGVLLVLVLVVFIASMVCKVFGWLPNITDWLYSNIYNKIGFTFFEKLGQK